MSNVIYENCSDWTTRKAYAPYVDVRQDDSITDICSPGSYGLNIVYHSSSLRGFIPENGKGNIFEKLINFYLVSSKNKRINSPFFC